MTTPVRLSILCLAALGSAGVALADDDATETISPSALREAVKMGLPKFDPAQSAKAAADKTAAKPASPQDPGLVQMNKYTVTGLPPPKPDQVLSQKARADKAMKRYLGDADGLDRGFLNRFTLTDLWKKIPVLGRLPVVLSSSNEERALAMAREDERIEEQKELTDLASAGQSRKDPDVKAQNQAVTDALANH
jgi:hypothetical protein